jgi:hypothetical protein
MEKSEMSAQDDAIVLDLTLDQKQSLSYCSSRDDQSRMHTAADAAKAKAIPLIL